MRELSLLEAIREAMFQEMERDERVMVLGQDVGSMGGVFRATDGLQQKFGADRVVDTPLAEAAIAATAIGLAVSGMRPIAEIQFLGFTHQAFHHVAAQMNRIRFRSSGHLNVPLTLRTPFGGLVRTPEHHGDALEAQYVQVPGIKIVMPATAHDAKGLLLASLRDPDPVLFCEPLRGYRLVRGPVPEEDYEVPLGQARLAREGDDVTLIAWSAAVGMCELAADELRAEGVGATVVDLRTLVPFDVETVVAAASRTGRVVVVHEAPLSAGFGAEVVATIQEEAFYDLEAPIQRVAAWDTPYPPTRVEEHYFPSVARIVDAVHRMAAA